MPSLSGDSPAGFKTAGLSVLVLRLESDRLEIGFGTVPSSSQESLKARLQSDPALGLIVVFPQNGETGVYKASLIGGDTGQQLRAFSLDVLTPFDFGGISYDPLASMAASLSRLATEGQGIPGNDLVALNTGSGRSYQPNEGLMALWAAIEADLYRFAKDPGFTAAVDMAAVEDPEEYRRFARLNELYRDLVKLLVPYGLVPRLWTAWLRGQEYRPILPGGLALRIGRLREGSARQPRIALVALTELLAKYGSLILLERD